MTLEYKKNGRKPAETQKSHIELTSFFLSDTIIQIVSVDSARGNVMSLISFSYVIFLPIVVLVNFTIPRSKRYIWLFLAGLVFYLSSDMRYAVGLLFCITTTYASGLLTEKVKDIRRKTVLVLCIFLNILVLFLFRHSPAGLVGVPAGISFYMLQSIGYLIDVYRGDIQAEKNPVRYAVFVSFFPTVLSGPIQRGTDLLQQLREGRDFDYEKAHSGLYYLLWGYLLKLVISDRLGVMVDFAYDRYETMPGAVMLWATVLYAVQLYCDFAGYSALAIGTGKLLGFDLRENFSRPYFAFSIKDFWNRWHISLSSWLRDYIYIPLGGNRKGRMRKYLNLMITFLVSGLWHGAGLNFLAWGGLHGAYQIAGDLLHSSKGNNLKSFPKRMAGIFATFVLVDFAWIFFRADTAKQGLFIVRSILTGFRFKEMTYYGYYLLGGTRRNLLLLLTGIVFVFLIDIIHEKKLSVEKAVIGRLPVVVRWLLYVVLTLLILFVCICCYGQTASTFIYEKF